MSLVTRCPVCATTFRVSPAQLSSRGGRVRCGKCAGVFDGVTSLLTEEAVAALPAEPSPQLGLFDPRAKVTAPEISRQPPPADLASASAPQPHPEPVEQPLGNEEAILQLLAAPKPPTDTAPESISPAPAFLAAARPRTTYTLVWALLALLGLATLAGQAALYYSSELAVLLPAARAHLATACDALGCEVHLPRRADLMSIESSDLQAYTRRKGVIVLNALLRNRAPFAQEYPDLELTLTDQGDHPVIRRVLRPREYLQQKAAVLPQGVAGGAEEAVRVYFETGDSLATGYQLFLFYPCPPARTSSFWPLSYPSRCQGSRNN